MNKKLAVLLALLLAFVMMLASCGKDNTPPQPDGPDNPTPAVEKYTVTFVVAGESTNVEVEEGETPAFSGTVGDYTDAEHFYKFVGWDKELAPATADTTYTAQYETYGKTVYDIDWYLVGDVQIRTQWHEGELPVPPDVPNSEDDGYYYTFARWDQEIEPASENTFYRAVYNKEAKLYNVTFLIDGSPIAVVPTPYGTVPELADVTISPKGELNFVAWSNSEPITGETVCNAIFSRFDYETLKTAMHTIVAGGSLSARAHAAQLVALQENDLPGSATEEMLSFLRYIITGGKEPAFDLTPNFYFPQAAGAIAVAKATPTLWAQLSNEEVEKLDLLMKCMAVLTAIGTDDSNNYTTGPGFVGNYNKNWNPNYPLSNVPQIIFCVSYFGGADEVNNILKTFDYDAYIAKFEEFGWKNTLAKWTHNIEGFDDPDGDGRGTYTTVTSAEDVLADTYGKLGLGFVQGQTRTVNYTTPKAMLMEGGEVFCIKALGRVSQYVGKSGGRGIGVPAIGEKGYRYKGHDLNDLEGIWNYLLNYNYSGGLVTSKAVPLNGEYACYIIDGTNSPVQGVNGMMKEFNSGNRSSVSYCMHDFALAVGTTAGLERLGLYDSDSDANRAMTKMIWVGNTDFLYKATHGYVSYTGTAIRGDPKPTYGSGSTYEIWKGFWLCTGDKRYTLDDFDIPDPNASVVETSTVDFAKPSSGSPDLTKDIAKSANALASGKNWWTEDFIIEFSLNYDESTSGFEIRLRSSVYTASAGRGAIMKYVSTTGSIDIIDTLLTPVDASSPASIALGEYGWHRIAIQYHQGASATAAKGVEYSVLITVYVDGQRVGQYNGDAASFQRKGWLLYGATYSETAENHLEYTVSTPKTDGDTWEEGVSNNKVYCQFYRGKFYSQEGSAWFLEYGDVRGYCGQEPKPVAKVTYNLNGGEFVQKDKIIASGGYTAEYDVNNVTYYAISGREITLKTPEKAGYTFVGWYTTPDGTGDPVSKVTTTDGKDIVLYAVWEVSVSVDE